MRTSGRLFFFCICILKKDYTTMEKGPHVAATGGREISFDASHGLPHAPDDLRLRRVNFRTCPGSDLSLLVGKDVDATRDEYGVSRDAWWVVQCTGLPDRVMRLFRGTYSLVQLLRRYAFLDAQGCVNHRDLVAIYEPETLVLPPLPSVERVPKHLREAIGVPQFYANSGVCWFATLCWTSFANPTFGDFILHYMPEDLRKLGRGCLYSREDAEALRKAIWYRYGVGDDVEDDPSNDGCNGFSEFSVLCAKLGVPVLRMRENQGRLETMSNRVTDHQGKGSTIREPKNASKESHLLVLRYQDGDHHEKHPILPRVKMDDRRYKLLGMYMGQRKCGHQIGACSPSCDWRDWSLGDADLHKDGIGPIFMYFVGDKWRQRKEWWKAWRELVHVTKFGRDQLCNLSPHNERDDLIDSGRTVEGKHQPGQNSVDVLYFYDAHASESDNTANKRSSKRSKNA